MLKDMPQFTHFDCFSGYGGFTISAQKLGWETIGFSEIDKYAVQVLNYHYPNIKNYGDITKIKGEDLPVVDIITGGSPCQDLSVAGKGAGLDGARSGLFFHFIRLIKEKQPTYFVWENVKGALSSSKGWDFARVQVEMEQAGYDVQWQIINAKDFGVPQNRERVFAIGTRKGSGGEILFEQRKSNKTIDRFQGDVSGKGYASQQDRVYNPKGIMCALPHANPDNKLLIFTGGLSVRRLLPVETERLMGLEDNWTNIGISDTQRYKLCGNGVVVNCVDYIYSLIQNAQ